MRKPLFRIIVAAMCIALMLPCFTTISAQTPANQETRENPIQSIIEESEGNIEIVIPDDILEDVLNNPTSQPRQQQQHREQPKYKKGVNKVSGFRIQVFADSRNPGTLQSRARARGNAIAARFPKYRGQVYAYSRSPNWYCTIGNFKTEAEAQRALGELRRAFPSFASEMRVVRSNITVK